MGVLAINGGNRIRKDLFPAYRVIGEEERAAADRVLRHRTLAADRYLVAGDLRVRRNDLALRRLRRLPCGPGGMHYQRGSARRGSLPRRFACAGAVFLSSFRRSGASRSGDRSHYGDRAERG